VARNEWVEVIVAAKADTLLAVEIRVPVPENLAIYHCGLKAVSCL
jgi:hypothetical protein